MNKFVIGVGILNLFGIFIATLLIVLVMIGGDGSWPFFLRQIGLILGYGGFGFACLHPVIRAKIIKSLTDAYRNK